MELSERLRNLKIDPQERLTAGELLMHHFLVDAEKHKDEFINFLQLIKAQKEANLKKKFFEPNIESNTFAKIFKN